VGDGSVRPELEALATASGVRTHFAGETYREEEIGLCLMMADAVVAPGNVGLTAMHALAYGVPVITHSDFTAQMPEFEAIRPGVSGAFFRRNDVGDLVRVIREWLDAHPVRDHRVEEACRGIVSACYSPDVQAEIIARVTGAGPAGRKDAP
jgi:glycosyltransferase involved in cell wall biosynthesis